MSTLTFALLISLVVSVVIQGFLVSGFINRLRFWKRDLIDDGTCPPATVILCLRGGDPFLRKCIQGILTQDYPDFQVRFIVDSEQDPSIPILRSVLDEYRFSRHTVDILRNPLTSCSLKCSSLIQAIEGLGFQNRIQQDNLNLSEKSLQICNEFIALLDADTIPHTTWLRELATALVPVEIGAATGNRWYMPTTLSRGAMTRYVWNAAAVVQMYWYRIAWGGTLAIKLDSIRRAGMVDRWRLSLCEDTMLREQLRHIGQHVAFVPSLMMVNREDCTLESFSRWVTRQLLTAKLYHPLWLAVVGHGISSALLLLWGWATCFFLFSQNDWSRGIIVCLSMLTFQAFLTGMIVWIESAVSPLVQSRGESTDWDNQLSWKKLSWTVWTTQWVYTYALISCLFLKRVEWRGIQYDISGPWSIQMLGYQSVRYSHPESDLSNNSL
ncbi:MAG: glycosyltransferase family 2 protein [Planctomycetota bacterium]|nr:glycosyltransferase family 2 protein [Planctomycetota bacterium]